MCLGKNTPRFRWKAQSVRKRLKDRVTILGPVAAMTECGECKRTRGVVGQIEPSLDREGGVGGIGEARGTGLDQVVEVALRARFPFKVAEPEEILELRRGRRPSR